ncbi:unnamed protein product [Camellia sinensis]
MASVSTPHFVIFPFMSQGHTIPLLNLARLLRHRHISVTIFTIPANSASIRDSLTNTGMSIINLPFTEKLNSMSLFLSIANATKQMQPHFEQAIESLQSVSCIISDGFLTWTQQSAAKLGIPRLVFYGMSNYATTMSEIVVRERPHAKVSSDDEPFPVPDFPLLKLTRNDFEPPFSQVKPEGPLFEFVLEQYLALSRSQGLVVNSIYELEPAFIDYWSQKIGPRAWCVGPLCLAAEPLVSQTPQKQPWVQWLDTKVAKRESVLYVAFGSQADMSPEQLREIALGLEQAKVNFLWVLRSKGSELWEGFEERVKDRGIIVKEWVDQLEILQHESINGFLSHCGWNSVIESISVGVPILALPLMAEQHLNARMLVEEIGIGLRLMPSNGSVRGFVKLEEVEKMARELMEGERGVAVRMKVKEVRKAACAAMKEGGSSSSMLDLLINEFGGPHP